MNNVQEALITLIERFIQRQSLVLEAIRELHPDWVIRIENKGNAEFWSGYTRESWQAFVLDCARRAALGEWGENKEWTTFFHGMGCRLTHKVTQERIEWDFGSLRRFDRFWFLNHLEWLLHYDTDDKVVSVIREWYSAEEAKRKQGYKPLYSPLQDAVLPLLEELCETGLLSKSGHRYVLNSKNPISNSISELNDQ